MKKITHKNKVYNFVNEMVIDGVTYEGYRRTEEGEIKQKKTRNILLADGQVEEVGDLKKRWKSLKKQPKKVKKIKK